MVSINDIKIPPNSRDAEMTFLSCIFIDPTILAITDIKQKHFYDTTLRKIYKAMQKVDRDRYDIDMVTVKNVIGEEYKDILYDIISYSITSDKREDAQKIIIEKYNRRTLIKGAKELIDLAENNQNEIDDIMFKATILGSDVDDLEETKTLIGGSLDTMMKYFDYKEQPTILQDMGYDFLTAILGGWRAGALYVIAGATGQGKSTFALNLCIEAVKRGVKCSFFSTEMPAHEIHTRLVSRESKIESWKIERGKEEVVEKVTETIGNISKRNADCNVYDTFSNVQNLERLIAKEASLGSKIIFIDYIQQVRVNGQNRNLAIGDMTTMFKQMAIRYGIAIVGLSQLNRASQETGEPQLKDLRDSGSIEQDADVVCFLHGFDENVIPTTMGLYVKKNRHGEKGMSHIPYDKRYFLFYNP